MKFAYNRPISATGSNLARYGNLMSMPANRAEMTMDQTERLRLYGAAQRLIVADQPMVDPFALHGLLAVRRDIEVGL